MATPIRQELDQQRKEFVRWCGAQFEELIDAGIDPSIWITAVMASLHEVREEESGLDKAA